MDNLIYSDNPTKGSSYITLDGKFLNLNENKEKIIGFLPREITHKDLMINDLIKVNDGKYLYIYENAYIEINKEIISPKEKEGLIKYLDYLYETSNKKNLYLFVNSKVKVLDLLSKKNPNGFSADDIIKEIYKLLKKQFD